MVELKAEPGDSIVVLAQPTNRGGYHLSVSSDAEGFILEMPENVARAIVERLSLALDSNRWGKQDVRPI